MSAPKNNAFWKLRSKHGRDRIFSTPELLSEAAEEYFTATDKRKWVKHDWVGKDAVKVKRETETPYTISGFCLYVGVSRHWWNEFKKTVVKDKLQDFLEVIARIEDVMFTQKFEGAAVGAFNPNIISRELGLAEKVEAKNTNTNFNHNAEMTKEEIREISQRLEEEY